VTDEAVKDAASRIVEAIDHLIVSVQDVAEAIRAGTTKPYELPESLKPGSASLPSAPESDEEE
jgi:hypothetical protein